jgi:hypothetical protein
MKMGKKQKHVESMIDKISMFFDSSIPHYLISDEEKLPPQALLPKPGKKCLFNKIVRNAE